MPLLKTHVISLVNGMYSFSQYNFIAVYGTVNIGFYSGTGKMTMLS